VSLLLAGLVAAGTSGALLVGRWLAKHRGAPEATNGEAHDPDPDVARARAVVEAEAPSTKDPEEDDDPKNENENNDPPRTPNAPVPAATKRPVARPPEGPTMRLDGFVCQLGDVLMRITGEEAWLAGGVVLSESIPVAVLFVAPDAVHDCAIYVRAQSKRNLVWLEPLDPSAVLVGGEPPSSVEHRGVRFERARRLPLRPRRIGVGAPNVGDVVMVAEYESAGAERLLVLKGNAGVVHAYRGVELEEGSFEVIASGESTL
jgi:hypothetical protein